MKKYLALVLALILCLGVLAACNFGQQGGETTTVAPGGETEETNLDSALSYVFSLYKDEAPETPNDYTLVSKVVIDGENFTVTWTVSDDKITVVDNGDGTVTVKVPAKSEEEIVYVLTATVADAEGNTKTKEFNRKVPAFAVNTFAEYWAAEKDALVVVQGVVTGIVSKSRDASNNCLFLQDTTTQGGYYVYGMEQDPVELGIEIGMTVRASGIKDIYSGTHEVKPTGVEIVSKEITPVAPIDLTAAYTAAESLKDASLVDLQSALVTIKGVEITGQETSNGYYKFKLGELETYVRISGSTCAINKADQTTFIANHTNNRGYLADVTGIVSLYNGAFYLVPVSVDAYSNFQLIERTDAEKLEVEAGNIDIQTTINFDSVVTLPLKGATYDDVVISWTSDNACAVVDAEKGQVNVSLQETAQTVTLTATLTIGSETKTVTVTLNVAAMPTVVPSIVETPEADKAYKFFLTQENLGSILYINGEMNGYYFATTTNYAEAIDVYVEVVDGGYKLYYMYNGTKTYISVVKAMGDDGKEHINVVFDATNGGCVYTYNSEYKTLVTEIEGESYYLGTYGTYSTFSASKLDKAATSFVGHLAVMVDTSSISDTDKVATEKGALGVSKNEFANDGSIDLAIKGTTYGDVKITWTSDNACAVVDNELGKLTVTQQAQAQTVKLTATITCGDVTETVEFTITVAAKSAFSITVVDKPVADTAYLFYFVQANVGKTLYINGGVDGRYLTMTENANEAVKVYAEAVDDGYKFYIISEGAKLYINPHINADGKTALNYAPSTDVVLKYDATIFAWTFTIDGKLSYVGTYNSFETVSISAATYINADNTRVSQFPLELVVVECTHTYSNDTCDTTCNGCGLVREATAEHAYTDVCDGVCDNCNEETRDPEHKWANACDAECDCGATRTTPAHVDTDPADSKCDICGATLGAASGNSIVTFEFGENGSAHADGADIGTAKDIAEGSHTLSLTAASKVYDGAFDATGNSCIKFGSSKQVGTATFVVGGDVNSVVIKVANYKSNSSSITINGETYTLTGTSDSGEYDVITIDTTTEKTITITSGASGDKRCMINSIEFVG